MYRMTFGMMLAAAAGLGRWGVPTTALPQGQGPAVEDSAPRSDVPPSPWLQGDPADSLYRAARESLNRRDFRRAADLFAQLPTKFPNSGYTPDAFYWQAFALYRLGGESDLKRGLQALQAQSARYPKASTKGDAKALEARINGELARMGDEQATTDTRKTAEGAAMPDVDIPDHDIPDHDMPDHDLSDRCDDDSDDMKLAALNALIHMDAERARPILQKVLARRDAGSACLRQKAVFLVAQGGGDGVERVLVETARTDPDPEVREQAVFWLSQVEGDAAVAALDSILRSSKDPQVREKALFALSQHDSPKSQQALRTFAERADVSADLQGEGHLLDRAERRRGQRGLPPRPLWSGQGRGAAQQDSLLHLTDGWNRERSLAAQCGTRPHSAGGDPKAGPLLGRSSGGFHDRARCPVQHARRSGDAGAAHLRLLPERRARRGGQAARDRAARSQSRNAQEGAVLARPERRPPRGEGA